MERTNITSAIRTLEFVLQILDSAYWEASKMAHKDAIYNIISLMQMELNELAKLSVEDHFMGYEPIACRFRTAAPELKQLQSNLRRWVRRSHTANQLDSELQTTINLLMNNT